VTKGDDEFTVAKVEADRARDKLTGTLVDLQARINPRALARDAIEELREAGTALARKGLAAAKRHPLPLIGIGASVVAFLAKDWIIDAFVAHKDHATDEDPPRSSPHQDMAMPEGSSDD